jgi:hypothetical protein
MMRRRRALGAATAATGALVGLLHRPLRAASKSIVFLAVTTPAPMLQIAAGGPTGLLGVGADGALFALPLRPGEAAQRMAEALDPETPLATGHNRLAARRRDGALWVMEAGAAAVSAQRNLAPAAGLMILPLAIIAVAVDAGLHRVVRLEPAGSGKWETVARSDGAVLPDARPLQSDLEGSGDGGHVVVLAGPDSERYRHGVLGDAVEATRIALLERHSLRVIRELAIDAPFVFEDIAPRKVALPGGAAREGLLTVQSGPQGAQLVLVDADPTAPRKLRIAASGPSLGTANRWMSPTTDGRHWLAIHTPHIGGVLHVYQQQGERLLAHKVHGGVSNHRMGSRLLDISAWWGQRLLVPDQSGQRLLLLDGAAKWRVVAEHALVSRAQALVALGSSGQVAVLGDNGSVSVGAGAA